MTVAPAARDPHAAALREGARGWSYLELAGAVDAHAALLLPAAVSGKVLKGRLCEMAAAGPPPARAATP